MANYSLFSSQAICGELVNENLYALDAANDRIVAEWWREVKNEDGKVLVGRKV